MQEPQGGGAASETAIRGISDAIAGGSLERTMMALVERAVPDPVLRQKVIEQVMKLLEQDIATRVEEVTVPLKREKKTLAKKPVGKRKITQDRLGILITQFQ